MDIDKLTDIWMDECTEKQIYGRMFGQTDEWIDRDGWTKKKTDIRKDELETDRYMEGWMDRKTDK